MASYLDKIPQFREYVPQAPLELLMKAGMYKQEKYEQNVQKIYEEMEKVAGLDIYKDVDKKYLQSKLDELGGKLRMFAAGDFSNFQLAGSVAGMTKQIAKDANVQRAVAATAKLREEEAIMKEAIKQGKSSQANIYDFNKQISSYVNSPTVGDSFSGRYTQYTDVKKKALEAIKGLHPSLTGYDMPFVQDKNGNIDIRYYADAMKRMKIEGVDESKIKEAIYASLTPDDMNQLAIDARYQFRDVTPEKLQQVARINFESQFKEASQNLEILRTKLKTNGDPNKDKELKDNIAYYENLLGVNKKPEEGELYKQYAENVDNATNNPDDVKFSIYKDAFVKEFGNAFSWKNQETYFVKSPFKEQENFIKKMQEDMRQFAITTSLRQQEISLSREKFIYEQMKDAKEEAHKNAMLQIKTYGDTNNPWIPLSKGTDLSSEDAIKEWTKITTQVGDRIEGTKQSLLKSGYTQADINSMLADFQSGDPKKINAIDARAIGSIRQMAKDYNTVSQLNAKDKELKEAAKVNNRTFEESAKELESIKALLSDEKMMYSLLGPDATYSQYQKLYDGLVEKADRVAANANKAREAYGKAIADKYANLFIPALKAVGVGDDGKLTPYIATGVSKLGIRQKDLGIKSNENYSYSNFSDMMNGKHKNDTKVYVKQDGYNYQLIVSNPKVSDDDQVINVTANDIATYLSPSYINNLQEETIRLKISPNASTDINTGPSGSYLQSSFGDFPNIKKIQGVNASLLQDPQNENQYIPQFYIYNNSGDWDKFVIAGPNKDMRVGYEAGINSIKSLNDGDLLRLIRENFPNYDLNNIKKNK